MSTKKSGWDNALVASALTRAAMLRTIRTEAGIEHKVVHDAAKDLDVQSTKMGTAYSIGWPDRLFFIPGGRPLMIEFKRPGGKVSARQAHIHAELRKAGYAVSIHDDVDDALSDIASRIPKRLRK